MKFFTPEISWHERDPIYTCAFNPTVKNKFATAGVSGEIRLWEISDKPMTDEVKEQNSKSTSLSTDVQINFLANLKRHTKSVNVVRWNSDGLILASAGDESVILLWKENDIKNQKTLDNEEFENKENWFSFKTLRGHIEDILDLSWSSDSLTLISGSVDNSVIVWNVATATKIALLKEPKGFVQGVVYDPLGATYAVLSTDRCLRIFSSSNNKCIQNVNKIQLNKPKENASTTENIPNIKIFHDDTMKSFFRRMAFSPDGNLLFTPSGCLELGDKLINTSYIFVRNSYSKPCLYIPHDRPSVAISVCPIKFELIKREISTNEKDEESEKTDNEEITVNGDYFNIPYRYVYAVATEDSVFFYDTQSSVPFSYITGIHYSNLSDLSWSADAKFLLVTSIDGFCTFVFFKPDELGVAYIEPLVEAKEDLEVVKIASQQSNEPKQPEQMISES